MKTIEILGTSIRITVGTAREMYLIFFRFIGWNTLKVDDDIYHQGQLCSREFFQKKYF